MATVVAGGFEAWAAWRAMGRVRVWVKLVLLPAALVGLVFFIIAMAGILQVCFSCASST